MASTISADEPGQTRSGLTTETEGWSLPLHAPLYFARGPQFSLWNRTVAVSYRSDPQVLREFVPEPLQLVSDQVLVVVTYHHQPSHSLPVRAASIHVTVEYAGVRGMCYLLTLEPSDEVLCANREELGMPVILGDVEMWSSGNAWYGSARRDNVDLLRISVFPEKMQPREQQEPLGLILYKRIPSADPTAKPWSQILSIRTEVTRELQEYSVGRGAIELAPSEWGLHRIQPIGPVRGIYSHAGRAPASGKIIECLWEEKPDPIPNPG